MPIKVSGVYQKADRKETGSAVHCHFFVLCSEFLRNGPQNADASAEKFSWQRVAFPKQNGSWSILDTAESLEIPDDLEAEFQKKT